MRSILGPGAIVALTSYALATAGRVDGAATPPDVAPSTESGQRGGQTVFPGNELNWSAFLPTISNCMFCDEMVFAGSPQEAALWNRRHRLRAHPEGAAA